jgi:hypothetical protein
MSTKISDRPEQQSKCKPDDSRQTKRRTPHTENRLLDAEGRERSSKSFGESILESFGVLLRENLAVDALERFVGRLGDELELVKKMKLDDRVVRPLVRIASRRDEGTTEFHPSAPEVRGQSWIVRFDRDEDPSEGELRTRELRSGKDRLDAGPVSDHPCSLDLKAAERGLPFWPTTDETSDVRSKRI